MAIQASIVLHPCYHPGTGRGLLCPPEGGHPQALTEALGDKIFHGPPLVEGAQFHLMNQIFGQIQGGFHALSFPACRQGSFPTQVQSSELLKGNVQCGTYLGRLASQYPQRVKRYAKNGGSQKWMIKPPVREEGTIDEELSDSWSVREEAARANLIAKLRKSGAVSKGQCSTSAVTVDDGLRDETAVSRMACEDVAAEREGDGALPEVSDAGPRSSTA